jgi:SAM-dependent methyltransferase
MYIVRRSLTFARGFLLSYGPTQLKKALWNKEFSSDKWDFIDNTSGDCVYGPLEKFARGGDILDLGCGPGNTANELSESAYSTYLGVDISESALAKAAKRTNENGRAAKNSFACSDFLGYMPPRKFDVILFRESMYHVPYGSVLEILNKYSEYLKSSGGVFMVRLYTTDLNSGIIKSRVTKKIDLMKSNFETVEETGYDKPGTPTVLVFRPKNR